jgi:hypothetical protein
VKNDGLQRMSCYNKLQRHMRVLPICIWFTKTQGKERGAAVSSTCAKIDGRWKDVDMLVVQTDEGVFVRNDRLQNDNEKKRSLTAMRAGLRDDPDPVAHLSGVACTAHDQTLQKAALAGLAVHGTKEAVLAIAKRLLDSWGMGAISRCIQLCGRLADQGGLVVLSSTLFYDDRFITEKIDAMKKALTKSGDGLALLALDKLGGEPELHREPRLVNQWREKLSHVANLDIREGIIFGSEWQGTCGWIGQVPAAFSPADMFRARRYVNGRMPGLVDLYQSTLEHMDK